MGEVTVGYDPIISAGAFFAIKKAATELGHEITSDTGVEELFDELKVIRETIRQQPADFFNVVRRYNPEAAAMIEEDIYSAAAVLIEEARPEGSDDTNETQPTKSGVYYRYTGEETGRPYLFIDIHTISSMYKRVEPMFAGANELPKPRELISAAVIASCWGIMAEWMVNKLDPRPYIDTGLSPNSATVISKIAGLDEEADLHDSDVRREIDNTFEILKARMVGTFIYLGLTHSPRIKNTPRNIEYFQSIFKSLFDNQAKENPDSVTPTNFAFANPFKLSEARKAIHLLTYAHKA